MSLRDNLKTEKAKERYDKNYASVETTFSQKELEEHDKSIRNKAINDFMKMINEVSGWTPNCIEPDLSLTVFTLHQIAEELSN